MHAPITFAPDGSDNPNKGQGKRRRVLCKLTQTADVPYATYHLETGILKGCYDNNFFTRGTWNAEFVAGMEPKEGDIIIKGKRGLDAFPGTDLEEHLVENNIKTVVLGGLLTNCCVESTMRTAFEKGFNVVTLKDCTAATSEEGQKAAVEGTWGMFSTPMTKDEFIKAISK
jgi:nicotinamidase-related amidase